MSAGATKTTKVELQAASGAEAQEWADVIEKIAARSAHDEMTDVIERTARVGTLLCHVAVAVTVRKMKCERTNLRRNCTSESNRTRLRALMT